MTVSVRFCAYKYRRLLLNYFLRFPRVPCRVVDGRFLFTNAEVFKFKYQSSNEFNVYTLFMVGEG